MPTNDVSEQFHRLIKKGDVVALRRLIESGVSVNLRYAYGWTPLMLAANQGNTPLVSLLVSSGADIQAVNDFGSSPLAYAALQGNCQTIQVLLDAGASLCVQPHGVSLLEFAERGGGRFKTRRHFEMLRAAGAT